MLSVELDGSGVELDLREWVNSGLMAFFFFVVGLEARREFDLGDLRERSRVAVPVAAALGGMAIAIAVYLAFNAGSDSAADGGSRCRPTRRSRSGSSPSRVGASPTGSARSSSRWWSSTT